MKGRKPKPVALRLLSGNPGQRRINSRAPLPPVGVPDKPNWLDGEASACWDELAPILHRMGCLSLADGHAFARYCKFWSRWRRSMDEVDKHGAVVELRGKGGRLRTARPHPTFRVAMDCAAALLKLETEFAMTPQSRQRIHLPATIEADPLARFIDGRDGA